MDAAIWVVCRKSVYMCRGGNRGQQARSLYRLCVQGRDCHGATGGRGRVAVRVKGTDGLKIHTQHTHPGPGLRSPRDFAMVDAGKSKTKSKSKAVRSMAYPKNT